MSVIEPISGKGVEGMGLGHPLQSAGAPSAGTTHVQTLSVTSGSAGTFKLGFDGFTTAAIAYNASAADVLAALELLPNIDAGDFTASGGALPGSDVVLTAAGNNVKKLLPLFTIADDSVTGSTPAIAQTTPGVTATHRGAPKGAIVIDTTNGKEYINTGTALAPTWTVVGAQS